MTSIAKNRILEHLQAPEAKAYISKRHAEIELSVKIKKHRERLGLSQRELAEKMGVPQPTITRMESGESGINSTTLEKFCEVTGLEIDFIPIGEDTLLKQYLNLKVALEDIQKIVNRKK